MTKSVFTDAYRTFLQVLLEARRGARVSQVELAARIGKTQTWVSQVERGARRVDVIEFYGLARALDIDPLALFERLVLRLPPTVDL